MQDVQDPLGATQRATREVKKLSQMHLEPGEKLAVMLTREDIEILQVSVTWYLGYLGKSVAKRIGRTDDIDGLLLISRAGETMMKIARAIDNPHGLRMRADAE